MEKSNSLWFLQVFKCSALYPYNAQYFHENYSRMICNLILILNMALVFSLIINHVLFHNVFYSVDPIGQLGDFLETSLPLMVHITMVLEGNLKIKRTWKMHYTFKEIDDTLKNINVSNFIETENKLHRIFLMKFLTLNIIPVLIEIFIMCTIPYDIGWLNAWYTRIFSLIALRLGDSMYIYYVDHLTNYLHILSYELIIMQNLQIKGFQAKIEFQRKLKKLKEIDWKVWYLSHLINKRFEWFLAMNVFNHTVNLIIDSYWIFSTIYFKTNPSYLRKITLMNFEILEKLNSLFKESFLCVIPPTITFGLIFSSTEHLKKEVSISTNISFC